MGEMWARCAGDMGEMWVRYGRDMGRYGRGMRRDQLLGVGERRAKTARHVGLEHLERGRAVRERGLARSGGAAWGGVGVGVGVGLRLGLGLG